MKKIVEDYDKKYQGGRDYGDEIVDGSEPNRHPSQTDPATEHIQDDKKD